MANQPFLLQLSQCLQGGRNGAGNSALRIAGSKIDQIQCVKAQGFKVFGYGAAQLLRLPGSRPPALFVAFGSDFCGQVESVRLRIKRFANELIRDARSVGSAGVDVCNAACSSLLQHAERGIVVSWRAHNSRSGQLHRTVTETGERKVAPGPCAAWE